MDDLSFLILSKISASSSISYDDLITFHAHNDALGHYRLDEFVKKLNGLMLADLVSRSDASVNGGNYHLTDKGNKVLEREVQRRDLEKGRNDFQEQLSQSIYNANQSVIATNESVQRTNVWMTKNAKRQNFLTIGNMLISFAALAVAGTSLLKSYQDARQEQQKEEYKKTIEKLQLIDNYIHQNEGKAHPDSILLQLMK